jgi:hypothetical protein
VSDVTPGRAFHDTVISRRMARGEEPGVIAWQDVPAADKADLEAGAQAVTAVTLAAVTAELRELRDLSARQAHLITRVRGAFSEPDQYGVRHASMTRATFGRFLGEDGHGEAVSPDLSCGRCGSTVTAGRQPGQAPYERYRRAANSLWLSDGNPVMPESVEALPPVLQRAWEAVAGQEPQPDLPVTTPAVTRPAWGDVIVLAVGEDFPAGRAQELQDTLAALNQGVAVVTVRGVEALRAWEPAPELPLTALLADRHLLREALRRIALGNAGDPSVAADAALMASREYREQWEVLECEPQPAPELADALGDWPAILADVAQQRDDLRELLDEVGTLAANADEDGDLFGLLQDIAMKVAAVDVPDSAPARASSPKLGDLTISACEIDGHAPHAARVTVDYGLQVTSFCLPPEHGEFLGDALASGKLAAAQAELDKVQRGAATLGMVVVRQARDLYAMHIDVTRGDLEAVRQRVLNAIPDVDDNEPAEQWNGTETGSEWLERTRDGS